MALATMEDDLPTLQMTAQVIVRADNGKRMKIRILIDTGATSSLLATRVATRLGLPKTKTTTILKGAQGCPLKPSRMKTSFEVENKYQPSQGRRQTFQKGGYNLTTPKPHLLISYHPLSTKLTLRQTII